MNPEHRKTIMIPWGVAGTTLVQSDLTNGLGQCFLSVMELRMRCHW